MDQGNSQAANAACAIQRCECCRSQLEAHSFSYKPIPTGKKGNALSCYVPVFSPLQARWILLFPNNKDSVNLDTPDNEKVKQSDC